MLCTDAEITFKTDVRNVIASVRKGGFFENTAANGHGDANGWSAVAGAPANHAAALSTMPLEGRRLWLHELSGK